MFSWLKNLLAPVSSPALLINTSAKILQTAARPAFSTVSAGAPSATSEEIPGETALRFTRLIMVTAN